MKRKPKWVEDKERIRQLVDEPLIFVGEMGVAGVVDGLLPSGEPYTWYKRRHTKDTKFKGRRKS